LYAPDATFEPGGFHVHGAGDALALVSSGYMVHETKRAVEMLARQGYRAALIDCYSLPIDSARLADVLARCGARTLVVEDNYGGGIGSAVAEIAARTGCARVTTLHVSRYPKSTRLEEEELEYCGVSAAQIADHALALIRA
jgi:transketolase